MATDRRALRRYESMDEDDRLWRPGKGDLVRLRSWDIFERFLPALGRIFDVGGGPGTHAAHLAERGYQVTLVDPVPRHVDLAAERARPASTSSFGVYQGEARKLAAADGSVDAVLLMGPLYHLVEPADRLTALSEARRVLRPGGRLLAEIICRHAWLLDATLKGLLDSPQTWASVEWSLDTGMSQDPATATEDSFWAYFHRPHELRDELTEAGFDDIRLVAVEGFAWLLDDLEARMADPEPLVRAVRRTESEPSMLGCSAHVIGVASRP